MSSYYKQTKHPVTDKWEKANWIDDCLGPHKYGVEFSDGNIYNPEEMELETREEEPEKKDVWDKLEDVWYDEVECPHHEGESCDIDHFTPLKSFIKTHFIPRAEVVEKVESLDLKVIETTEAEDKGEWVLKIKHKDLLDLIKS